MQNLHGLFVWDRPNYFQDMVISSRTNRNDASPFDEYCNDTVCITVPCAQSYLQVQVLRKGPNKNQELRMS